MAFAMLQGLGKMFPMYMDLLRDKLTDLTCSESSPIG